MTTQCFVNLNIFIRNFEINTTAIFVGVVDIYVYRDIGINKGIVPTAVLGFLVISALTDGGDDSSPGRDWRPPGFPGALSFSIGF